MNVYDYEFRAIGGGALPMRLFAGKAVLIVNTASKCGFTPQYAGLQELWKRYRDRGFVVLGVPSNDFGAQEPGGEAAIQAFCDTNYRVDFPMTAKEPVKGEGAHPLYRAIADELGVEAGPKWNFHKILVAPNGQVAEIFPSKVEPLSAEMTLAVEAALPRA